MQIYLSVKLQHWKFKRKNTKKLFVYVTFTRRDLIYSIAA